MAATFKLTATEWPVLVGALEAQIGTAKIAAVLLATLGAERTTKLVIDRKAVPLTRAEKVALINAIVPMIPGDTKREKLRNAGRAAKKAFATKERFDEAVAYIIGRIKAYKAPPAASAVPSWDACTHASCWDGPKAEKRMMNLLSPAMPEARAKEYLDWQAARGANTVHLILANHRDGEFGGYSIYGSAWGWKVHQPTVDLMRQRIAECRRRGFAVVIWFITDDSSPYAAELKKDYGRYCRDVRDSGLLDQASIVVPALEKQDHFNSRAQVQAFISAIRAVWPGKVATHEVPGKTDFADLGDVCFYQIKPGKTAAQVKAEIAKVVAKVNRPVNAFEIARNPSQALCDAAFAGGAYAVGNCDGGPGPAQGQEPNPPADSVDFPAELSSVTWLHANVREWKQTAKLTASIDAKNIHFPYDKANVWPVAASGVGKGTNANVWAIVKIAGQWTAGTWEWLRKGQTSKVVGCLNGAKGDHFKVSPLSKWRPKSGEQFYLMVSGHARTGDRTVKERSNPYKVTWP